MGVFGPLADRDKFSKEKFQALWQSVGELFWARSSWLVLFKPHHIWLIRSALSGTYQDLVLFFLHADVKFRARLAFAYPVALLMASANVIYVFTKD